MVSEGKDLPWVTFTLSDWIRSRKKNHRSAAPRVPLPSSVYARFHGRTGPPSQSSLPFLHSLGSPQIFCGSLFCKLLCSEFNTSISSHQRAFLWSFKTKDSTLRISEFRSPRRLPDRLPIDPKPRMWTDYPINEIVPIWCYSLLNFCENCSCLEVVLCEQLGEKQNSKPGVVKKTPACPQWCWSASSCRCSFRPHCGTLTPGPVKLCPLRNGSGMALETNFPIPQCQFWMKLTTLICQQ